MLYGVQTDCVLNIYQVYIYGIACHAAMFEASRGSDFQFRIPIPKSGLRWTRFSGNVRAKTIILLYCFSLWNVQKQLIVDVIINCTA